MRQRNGHVLLFQRQIRFLSDLTEKQFTAVNYQITGLVCLFIWHPESMKCHVLSLQSTAATHVHYFL